MLKRDDDIENAIRALTEKESPDDHRQLGFGRLSLSEDQRRFVNRMVTIHGDGVLSRSKKSNNIELQLADPLLLQTDGDKELRSRHLFVNVDKVVNDHHWHAARCVKDGRLYDVRTLLQMLPIEQRAIQVMPSSQRRRVSYIDKLRYMVRDANGNLVPPGPGETVPLTELPSDHPAIQYIKGRNFCPKQLVDQFQAAFCTQENADVKYKRLPGGFSGTPQGRIVFFIDQLGVRRGWQARQLDRVEDTRMWLYHPYEQRWVVVAERASPRDAWEVLPAYDGRTMGKAQNALLKQKYVIGVGVEKTVTLMGFDAAIQWNQSRPKSDRVVGLVEGVLDAASLGMPFCAIMGLRLSSNQAALISNHFSRAVCVPDNDNAENAETFLSSISRELGAKGVPYQVHKLADCYKDAGELPTEEASTLRQSLFN